jgi:hypothetical protein
MRAHATQRNGQIHVIGSDAVVEIERLPQQLPSSLDFA